MMAGSLDQRTALTQTRVIRQLLPGLRKASDPATHPSPSTLKSITMPSKAQRIAGWILTGLLGLFLIGASGIPKFVDFPGKKEMFDHLGITTDLAPVLGVLEITVAILFLIPRTSIVGAILVTGYLGGAIWAHLRVGDPWFFPIIIGVLMWVALGLRYPAIFALALGRTPGLSNAVENKD